MQQNASGNPDKCTSSIWLDSNLDSADEGQNWDMVMFLVTTLEIGYKKKKTHTVFMFHLRIYFVAFLRSLSRSILQIIIIHNDLCKQMVTSLIYLKIRLLRYLHKWAVLIPGHFDPGPF